MKNKKIIRILSVFLLSVLLFSLSGCYQGVYLGKSKVQTVEGATNFVQLEMADGGKIIIELYPDVAPGTVANFQKLVSEGFYDGLTFHRVVSGFVIQCGDPTGTGLGGSDETIKGEFSANGVINELSHTRGVVSMGRKGNDYDSASSHFFICLSDSYKSSLDGQYAAFGKVVEGMDVVDAIAAVKVDGDDKPIQDQIVKTASFVEYTAQ